MALGKAAHHHDPWHPVPGLGVGTDSDRLTSSTDWVDGSDTTPEWTWTTVSDAYCVAAEVQLKSTTPAKPVKKLQAGNVPVSRASLW